MVDEEVKMITKGIDPFAKMVASQLLITPNSLKNKTFTKDW